MADNGIRAGKGIAVCLLDVGGGHSRLVFDDVMANGAGRERSWRHHEFFTSKVYSNASLKASVLSDEQYRDIGFALVTRLLAVNGRLTT